MKKNKVCKNISNLLISFIINTIFLVFVILFCDMKYEVSDDFIMDSILSGAYGNGYDPHLLFSNILLGYLLKIIYTTIPGISWYFVGHILICFLSLTAVSYVILSKNNKYIGIMLNVIFVSFFSDDVYILVQFTKTAGVAICSGGILYLYAMWNEVKHRKIIACLGGVLAVIGTMIRFECIYIAGIFLLITFFKYVWDNKKKFNLVKKSLTVFASCVVLVGCAFAINGLNNFIWNMDSEYAQYMKYNKLRASVVDVMGYGYETIENQLDQEGITLTDYCMVDAWDLLDRDYFTDEKLECIAHAKKEYSNQVNHDMSRIIKQFLDREYYKYTIAIGLFVIFIISTICAKSNVFVNILECVITVCLLCSFFYSGRVVYRVEYVIFFCAAATIVSFSKSNDMYDWSYKISVAITIVCILFKIPLYIPDNSYMTMDNQEYSQYIYDCFYESWNYNIKKYRCDVNHRQPQGQLIKYIKNNNDNYYLIDFNTGIQLIYYNYKPWLRMPEGYFEEYAYLGGVQMRYPDELKLWQKKGIDINNPNKSIVNENIYIIDNYFKDTKMWYLREKYFPNATVEMVDNINGFSILKYYVN